MNIRQLLDDVRKAHKLSQQDMVEVFLPSIGKQFVIGGFHYKVTYVKGNPLRFTAEITTPSTEGITWQTKFLTFLKILWIKLCERVKKQLKNS